MKNFIEVTTDDGKCLVNINCINFIRVGKTEKTHIIVTATGLNNVSLHIKANESYENIKDLIQEAL